MTEATQFGAYGREMGDYFHLAEVSSVLIPVFNRTHFAITRLRSEKGVPDCTSRIPPEDAFVVTVELHPASGWSCETWTQGTYSEVPFWPLGGVGIYDLRLDPVWRSDRAFECIQYYFPRTALDTLTGIGGLDSVEALSARQGQMDSVLHELSQIALLLLRREHEYSQAFLEHFFMLIGTHLVKTYGNLERPEAYFEGGLAPWQKRRVTELLRERPSGELSLAVLARECRLSISHFARAFKKTFGSSVHQYLLSQRVQTAKELMLHSRAALSDIAIQAGFSDQAAFCRTFASVVGATPGRWRRQFASVSDRTSSAEMNFSIRQKYQGALESYV
jgi:AraC family transcriptional regulator